MFEVMTGVWKSELIWSFIDSERAGICNTWGVSFFLLDNSKWSLT